MGYSKEFLICAFLYRYSDILLEWTEERMDKFVEMIERFYDEVGKDKFRVYASLDADTIKQYNNRIFVSKPMTWSEAIEKISLI